MALNTSPTIEACLHPPEGAALQRDDWQAMLTQIMQAAFYGQSRVVSRATSTTLAVDDAGTLNRATAALTLTLPLASEVSNGWGVLVMAEGGDVAVSRSGADYINGDQTSLTVARGSVVSLVCDGTGFRTALQVGAQLPPVAGNAGKMFRVNSASDALEFHQPVKHFESTTGQAPSLSTTRTFAHGLGVEPTIVQVIAECVQDANGYEVGDRLFFSNSFGYSNIGHSVWADASNVYVRVASGGMDTVEKNSGSTFVLDALDWLIHVKAAAFF